MGSSFPVFGFMDDGARFNLHLANAQVSLKILTIGLGVPKGEFHIAVERYGAGFIGIVNEGDFLNLRFFPRGNHEQKRSF